MVVELNYNEKYENYELKTRQMLPFEYVIVSKPTYAEPLTGESKYGTWCLFQLKVHEFCTVDEESGEKYAKEPEELASYFANGKTLREELTKVPLNTRVQIYMEKNDRGFKEYRMDYVDEKPPETTKPENAVSTTAEIDAEIKALKDNGVDKSTVVSVITKNHDVTKDIVERIYDAV